jgi:hypothetical protein
VSVPKEQWQITDALVYSVDWIDPSRNEAGHYNVVYSYKVSEERYTGEFSDYSNERDTPLHRDDVISIRYCPDHPTRSYYPDVQKSTNPRLILFAIGAGVGLIVLLIVYFSGGLR